MRKDFFDMYVDIAINFILFGGRDALEMAVSGIFCSPYL